MNLAGIRPTAREIPIKHPGTNEPTGLVWRLMSPQDAAAGEARRVFNDRVMSPNATEADTTEYLALLSTGWTWGGDANWKGARPEFSAAAVREVLGAPDALWLRNLLFAEIRNSAAFFTA